MEKNSKWDKEEVTGDGLMENSFIRELTKEV